MSRWIKGLVGILFVVGIVSVSSVPAYAVAGAGPKAVVTGKGGNPIAGARVTITRQDGSKEEKETDRAGVVVLNDPYGDSERGILPIANIGIELVDGSTYFFDGPFGNPLIPPGSQQVSLNLAQANSVRGAQTNGVWVTGANGGSDNFPLYKLSVNYGYKWGSMETMVDRGGNKTKGEDIDVGQSEIRLDGRLYYGPLMNLGYFGNLSNLGNYLFFGNLGNIGSIGNFGRIGVSDCYGGVQIGIGISARDTGLNTDEHPFMPDGVTDTVLKQKYKGSLKPYIGCKVADFDEFGYFNLQAGPVVSFWDYEFITDEDGNLDTTRHDDTKVGAAFGVEYNKHFSYGNLGNFGGLGNLGNEVYGGLQLSFWTEYVRGFEIMKTTSLFDYTARTEGAWISSVYAGWGMYF